MMVNLAHIHIHLIRSICLVMVFCVGHSWYFRSALIIHIKSTFLVVSSPSILGDRFAYISCNI